MNIKINPSAVLGAVAMGVCAIVWALAQSFVGTVYANDKVTATHTKDLAVIDIRFAGYDAMRPQLQEVMMKVQNIERKLDEVLDYKTKNKGH